MSRYTGPKEKLSRKVGENLALKPERSVSPKSAFLRKPYRPGMHGKRSRRAISEFGAQLLAKQKIRYVYGVTEKQFKKYFKSAKTQKGVTGELLLKILESRLDNVVFRAGLAASRSVARQMVSHGHFLVGGRRITIPSYQVRPGDLVAIRPQSKPKKIFEGLTLKMKKFDVPSWLSVDKTTFEIKVKSIPDVSGPAAQFNTSAVIEFYSR